MAYTGVYVLGDSLVDAGNALRLAQFYGGLPFTDLPEGAPTADKGYFQGRFSDGYVFTDLISNKAIGVVSKPVFPYGYKDPEFGIPLDPFAGDPSGNNLNFAYGGAHILQGDEAVPELDGQTDALRDAYDGKADPNALYSFTFGGNDVRDLAPTATDPMARDLAYAEMREIAAELLHEIGQVIRDGARNIVITGMADVGLIPKYDRDGNGTLDAVEQMRSDTATEYSIYLDTLIRTQVVPQLQQQLVSRGADPNGIIYVPLMDHVTSSGQTVTGALNANLPMLALLHNVTPPADFAGTAGQYLGAQLDSHALQYRSIVFFDGVHPNAQANALLASYMHALITKSAWVETMPLLGADVDYRTAGTIGVAGEVDSAMVSMIAGTTYTFQMLGISTLTPYVLGQVGLAALPGGPILADPSLRLVSSAGAIVKSDDDSGAGLDAVLSYSAAAAGAYTLQLSAVGSLTGSYVLTATVTGAAMAVGNIYTVNNPATLVLEGAGGMGVDVVKASVSYTLAAGSEIEELRTTNDKGKTAINLTGNDFAQTIVGNNGANVIEGRGGADVLTGGGGNDRFVLSNSAVLKPGAANVDRITDYSSGDVVDVTQILSVAAGTNVASSGYLRVTTNGLVQVDLDGGGNNWVTLSTINGSGSVTVRYLAGGAATNVSLARVNDPLASIASVSVLAGAVAAAGLMAAPLAAESAPSETSNEPISASPAMVSAVPVNADGPGLIGSIAGVPDAAATGDQQGVFARADASAASDMTGTHIGGHGTEPLSQALSQIADGTAPQPIASAVPVAAHAVMMPSADALLAGLSAQPGSLGETRITGEVGRVLVDALEGGATGAIGIDAVLDSLPGGAARHAVLEALGSESGDAAWVSFAQHHSLAVELATVHQDGPPAL